MTLFACQGPARASGSHSPRSGKRPRPRSGLGASEEPEIGSGPHDPAGLGRPWGSAEGDAARGSGEGLPLACAREGFVWVEGGRKPTYCFRCASGIPKARLDPPGRLQRALDHGHKDGTRLPEPRMDSAAAEAEFVRLAAGGNRIRTLGPPLGDDGCRHTRFDRSGIETARCSSVLEVP